MDEMHANRILELHSQLEAMEARVTSKRTIVTGVQGVRIMRLVALMSGYAFQDGIPEVGRRNPDS